MKTKKHRTFNNNIFQARRGENALLSAGRRKRKMVVVYLVAPVSDVRWWDITANSSRRTKTAPWWLN